MKTIFTLFSVILFFFLFESPTQAQLTVNTAITQAVLAQSLVGNGVAITNVTLNCSTGGYGVFTTGVTPTNLGIHNGIILTSGDASATPGPNTFTSFTGTNTPAWPGGPGDVDLDALITPITTHDACVLTFDCYVPNDTLKFNYVFGSDEYETFANGSINDAFGLFISGPGITGQQDIAIVPATTSPISINSINCTVNNGYYVCNDNNSNTFGGMCTTGCPASNLATSLEYNGFTTVMHAIIPVLRCNTYHLKFAIADGSDNILDSGVFIEPLTSDGVVTTAIADSAGVGYYPNLVEGCKNGSLCFKRTENLIDTLKVKYVIGGTAINGVDYQYLIDSVMFYPGDTLHCLSIVPIADGVTEPIETVVIQLQYLNCQSGLVLGDSVILRIQDPLQVFAGNDTIVCSTPVQLNPAIATGYIPPPALACGAIGTGCGFPSVTMQVGNGNDVSPTTTFVNGVFQDTRTLMIYSAADLLAAGLTSSVVNSLAFNVTQINSTAPYDNLTIKIGCAPSPNPVLPASFPSLSQVYGPTSFTPALGWNTFAFTNTYDWDGVNGLYVEVCYDNNNTTNTASDVLEKTNTATNTIMYAENDFVTGCSMVFGGANITGSSTLRPNTKFTVCQPPVFGFNYTWTPLSNIVSGANTASPLVTVGSTATFHVKVTTIPGCPVEDSMVVNYVPPFAMNIVNRDTFVCLNQPVQVNVNGGSSYTWQTFHGGTVSCPNCGNPICQLTTGTDTFIVSATGGLGCVVRDTVVLFARANPVSTFTVTPNSACSNVPVAAAFTGTTSATGPAAVFNWNFNGGSSTTVTPNTNYNVSWQNATSLSLTKNISLSITQAGCSSTTTTLPVTILPNPIADVKSTTPLVSACSGSPISIDGLNSTTNPSGSSPVYNWNWNGGVAAPGGTTVGPHAVTWTNATSSSVTHLVTLSLTQDGCSSSNMDSLLVTIFPIPQASFTINPATICANDISTFSFNGITNNINSVSPVSYTWNFAGGIANPGTGAGPHSVKYSNSTASPIVYNPTLQISQDGCISNLFTTPISVNPLPVPIIVSPGNICQGQTATLTVTPAFNNYLWNTGSTNDSIFVKTMGQYYAVVTDGNNCVDTGFTILTVNPLPMANAGTSQTIYEGNTAVLDGSNSTGGDVFAWSPVATLDNSSLVNPGATPLLTTTYILLYTNNNTGCSSTSSVVVNVKNCQAILLPNAFTPNGDGVNDLFAIINPEDFYLLLNMQIFDRWGQRVFDTNDKTNRGWDGTFKNEPMPTGTYIYVISAKCGGDKIISVKGDISLLR